MFAWFWILQAEDNMTPNDESLTFDVEWFDPTMEADRKFTLTYYLKDNSVEMVIK